MLIKYLTMENYRMLLEITCIFVSMIVMGIDICLLIHVTKLRNRIIPLSDYTSQDLVGELSNRGESGLLPTEIRLDMCSKTDECPLCAENGQCLADVDLTCHCKQRTTFYIRGKDGSYA